MILTFNRRSATVEECAEDGGTVIELSRTWQEIHDAIINGVPIAIVSVDSETDVIVDYVLSAETYMEDGKWSVQIDMNDSNRFEGTATSANGIPKYVSCEGGV